MDLRQIKKLIELLQRSGITEIEITEGKESVRIRATDKPHQEIEYILPKTPIIETEALSTIANTTPHNSTNIPEDALIITSPMVGTVYLASKPADKPYVQVGQVIKVGDIVCTIMAMNMIHKIEADKAGKIKSIFVDNGTCVEYGQPLLILE